MLYRFIDFLQSVHTWYLVHRKVLLKISVYGSSSFIVRNVRLHSTWKNQCASTYRMFYYQYFSGCYFCERSAKNIRQQVTRVRYPRGKPLEHPGRVPTWDMVSTQPRTLRASLYSPHTALEPTLLALGPNPSSHQHPRPTSLRHVQQLHHVTREKNGTYCCYCSNAYDICMNTGCCCSVLLYCCWHCYFLLLLVVIVHLPPDVVLHNKQQ